MIELQGKKVPNALLWVVGIFVILFGSTGIKVMSGQTPASKSHAYGAEAPEAQPGLIRSGTRMARSTHAGCSQCGVIDSIREVETRGAGSMPLGNHFAGSHGKDLTTTVGAARSGMDEGGIEKRSRSASNYDITIRLDNGSSHVVRTGNASAWHTGDQVKIIDGAIHAT